MIGWLRAGALWLVGAIGFLTLGVLARLLLIGFAIVAVLAGAAVAGFAAGLLPPEIVPPEPSLLSRMLGREPPTAEMLRARYVTEARFNGGVVALATMLLMPIARSMAEASGHARLGGGGASMLLWGLAACALVAVLVGVNGGFEVGGSWWPAIPSPFVAALVGMGGWYLIEAVLGGGRGPGGPGRGGDKGGGQGGDAGGDIDLSIDLSV